MRDYNLYLEDILQAIDSIEKFVIGLSQEKLEKDDKTTSAVIRKFEIIGEAAKNIPDSIKKQHPEVPWRTMIGFRNRLIHEYLGIDYYILWDTIHQHLPNLKNLIKTVIENIKKGG